MKACILLLACLLVGCDKPAENPPPKHKSLSLQTYDDSEMNGYRCDDIKYPGSPAPVPG